jgi:hypothetical protein
VLLLATLFQKIVSKKDYPQSHFFSIYGRKEKLLKEDILGYPLKDFLLALTPEKTSQNKEGILCWLLPR